ncbi:titin isoform X2 [Macrosteles quadrilineatus]|uniref:titin isoform X2 n=1 Tax=Macrosteles quadrilineatus TaxID=74068 RepID=UPI0023E2518B|nr:titin isoform X2 [Macrosteles quadrilineatus]
MLDAHLQVLEKIHSKQSPVEELLRQADQLVASQHTRAEVYNAMAESLSAAWQDVNSLLQRRKEILELNVKYHSDAAVCLERTRALELACSGAPLPVQVSDLRELLNHLSEVKRSMLESLMAALQDGRALLDLLRQLAAEGTLDSRPGQVLASTQAAISQVERWLEELHDRRRALEFSWQTRKTELEQCLTLALLTTDLRMLEEIYADRLDSLSRHHAELGDSESSARLLLDEHLKLLPEAKELQDQGLKILRATEQLAATGHFAGEDAIAQAYQLLNTSTEYLDKLDLRERNLTDAITFFTGAQMALHQLTNLERELSSSVSANQLSSFEHSVNEICSPVVSQGYQILESIPAAKGVQNKVEEIENLKLKLSLAVSNIQEEKLKSTQALNNFLEKQNQLYSWLVNTAESFINGHQDMGSVLAVAKDFLQLHHKMLNDLQMKGTEINALLSTVPDLLISLDESDSADVQHKAEALRNQWSSLKLVLEKRLELAAQYVKFHTLIVELASHVDSLTERLNGKPAASERGEIDETFATVTQIFSQLGNVGENFKQDSYQGPEPLDTARARLSVDTLSDHFTARVTGVRELRDDWERRLDADRHSAQRWTNNMADSEKTVDWVSKLDGQLYPVLGESVNSAKATVRDLETSRDRVLSEVKRAQGEVQLRISTADEILAQGGVDQRDSEVLSQLKALQDRLQQVVTDYQVLVQMFVTFFKNLSELEHTVQGLEGQYDSLLKTSSSTTLADVEKALREHDASRQAIQELFKFAQTESQQLIARIRQQEPDRAADRDTEQVARTLESLRSAWERAWAQHRMALESQQQLAQFDCDLGHIHGNLDELGQQLAKVKGQYGENLAAAKATSLAFHYFEKTIELLEQRIETFMGAGDAMLKSKHSSSPHIQHELLSLRTRWHQFHEQVIDTRKMIDLSLQYFALIEEAEDWFREGSRLLMTIAKRSSTIRTPEEANELLQEIELFLKPGESKQDERIQNISAIAIKLYGGGKPDHINQVKSESREMIDSFSQVSLELQQIINFLNKPPEEQQKEIVGLQEALPIEEAPTRKTPSPPLKKVKLGEPEPLPPNFTLPLYDATIDEGSRFTFECRVTGIPRPEICWLKDNISIGSNLDYHTREEDDGLCSLTIEETFAEDSACFTCRATNTLGYAETTALLTVRENERESAPVFVRPLAPLTTQEDSPVSLVCVVEGTPLPTVQWFRDGLCVDTEPRYTITYNNGEAVLALDQATKHDQGVFSCKATNRIGSETTAASLSIQPKISDTAPVFVTPLSNVMARAGQKIKLEGEVSGSPEPQLQWNHNGKMLPEARDIKVQYQSGKIVLTIPEAFPKDAGTYSLTATNSAGSVTGSCTVTVKGRLPTETSDSEMASDLEPTKPSIPTPLRDSAVFEGGKARMECVIIGQPEPEVIWYHEGVPVKESKEVQLLFQGDRCSLVIAETLPEDAGLYKVVAINSAGEASSSCHLTVQKSGIEPELPPSPVVELQPSGLTPVFISLLTDALATEGDCVTLECAVKGEPTPSVSWSLNNNPLLPSDRIKMNEDSSGLCILTINPVTAEDKGVYTARATNPLGEAKCFSHLIVKSAANLTSATASAATEEPRTAPTVPAFTELFADRSVVLGASTKFECIVTGKPTPKVRWLFNDAPVSGSQFLPSVSGSRQVLTIPSVTSELVGKVTCTAENEAGRASCTADLTVADAPPVDDLLQSIDQLNLTEMKVFEMKREVMMQSSTHSQHVVGGGEPTVQVHGVASRHEHTSKQIGDQPAVQTESHKTSEYHNVGGVEEKIDTQSHSAGMVPPGAVVPTGAVVPARPAQQRRQVPPRFVTPVMGKIVDQGVDVTLECILEGYPTPEVTWKKNGQPVVEGDRLRTSWELNKARLQMSYVHVEDAGKYSCTAVNPAGTATCTADLVIKKHVFPPVFGRRLRADTVPVGKRTVLEVEVTGTPDPSVTWYKDGQQIAASSSMYRVLAQGNSHRLIIEQASHSHSGRYEARATNDGGEARTAADLLIVDPLESQPMLPADLGMDIFKPSDLSSSKHTVSVTESFKSDKKISIHVEKSATPFDLDLPTLSIKQTELPSSNYSEKFDVSKKEEKETIYTPMQEPVLLPPIQALNSEMIQSDANETVIEDSSISKKSALSFFKNIIKENEEETKSSKQFEPVKKPFISESMSTFESSLPPLYVENLLPEPVSFTQTSFQETSQNFESIYTSDGLVLQPEPPPEMGFISKSQVFKNKDEISEKVKKLEESHKLIPEEQIPSGGVRIFPTPQKAPPEKIIAHKVPPQPLQTVLSDSTSTQTSIQETIHEPVKPPLLPESSFQTSYLPSPPEKPQTKPAPVQFNVAKFDFAKKTEPSQTEVSTESFNSFQSSSYKTETLNGGDFGSQTFDSLGPIIRPSADIQVRPQSPRPSAEGVNMEKLWTLKQKEDIVEYACSSPVEFFAPVIESKEFKSEEFKSFKEIKHTASPVPSATGLALEKLWAAPVDKLRPLSSLSIERPKSALSDRPKSPSAEGLAMDKIWAHKVSTQKMVWPPVQPKEEPQTSPPWSQKTDEASPSNIADISSQTSMQNESFTENNVKYESQSFSKMESSSFSSSNFSENIKTSESAFKEFKNVKPYIPPTPPPPESKIIYVAEAHASHTTNIPAIEPLVTESSFMSSSQSYEKMEKTVTDSSVVEERVIRPSEAVKLWPPPPKESKECASSYEKREIKNEFSSSITGENSLNNIPLQPGPPPEIGFAEPPKRRQSYVESIEQDIEKNIDKTPSKHLPGAVRIIPPPLKKEKVVSSEVSSKKKQVSSSFKENNVNKKPYEPESINKPLPKLEPFPYKPDPPRNRPSRCPPPPRPSRFVKGSWTESEYESDCDSVRIPIKWNPWQSDSEDYCYKKVKPPTPVATKRPHSASGRAVPPTEFEKPPPLQGPSKPAPQPSEMSKSAKSKIIKTEEIHQKSVVSKSVQNKSVGLKPGSPPQYVEAPAPKHKPAPKPGSPKAKTKVVQPPPSDGYTADTDEPSRQYKASVKTEESVVSRMEQSVTMEQKTFSSKTSTKKESSQMEFQSSVVKREEPPLEPFPFKPDPVRPAKRSMGPPPPSPSKFIKGEFRESDYESEYEGKIKPIWRPGDPPEDMSFRPVRPVLTPVSGKTQNIGRTPTPPTAFDEPPSFNGPPRPKFEPIDKPTSATKVKETIVEKTKVIRPTPVQYKPQAPSPVETIYATPASRPVPEFILKPGSPPRMDYAPPRPGYVEKSNIVNFTESTASSKRVVSVQQTTRVVPLRKENIPPKFSARDSDYDSEVDGVVRTSYLDAEKKRLKRVEEMKRKFLESEPHLQPGEPPEFAFSPEPSKLALSPGSPWLGTEGPKMVRAISPGEQPKKVPLFITPLRDIACVNGQPARFECIVLAEPSPDVVWSKDGSVLTPSPDHQTEYRNGVCRLTLPIARPFDAGQYSCTANNIAGSATTSASLQVPGERRNVYP